MDADLAGAQAAAVTAAERIVGTRPRAARPTEEFLLIDCGGPFRAAPTATPGIYLVWVLTAPATARRVRQAGWLTWWSQRRGVRTWEAASIRGVVGPLPSVLVAVFQSWFGGAPALLDSHAKLAAVAALTRLLVQQPAMEAAYLAWIAHLRRRAAREGR